MPFGVTAYGWSSFDAYGFTGGVCLASGAANSTISLTVAPATTNPIISQAQVTAAVRDAFGNPLGGVGVRFKVTGVNPANVVITSDASGNAVFTYTGLVQGSDLVSVTADQAAANASLTWVSNGPNQPPLVNAGPDQTISLPANTAQLNGSVVDDGLPVGGTLTFVWTQIGGPAGASFGAPSQPITQVTFSVAGTYVLQLTASDSLLSASDSVTITVLPPNQAPAVNAGADQTLAFLLNIQQGTFQTATLSGTASDDGLPQGSTLAVTWSLYSGPNPVSIAAPANLQASVHFDVPGAYVFQLSASDSQFTANSYVAITIVPPIVNAGPDVTTLQSQQITLNGSVTINGQAAAGSQVSGISWALVTGPGTPVFTASTAAVTQVTFSVPGTYVLRLTAGSTLYSDTITVYVMPSSPPPPLSVAIASPLDDTEITAPTAVTGSVSGGTWTLEYALQEGSAPPAFVTLATGSTAVVNATLGTLDPTVLLNGGYSIRLRTADAFGQSASATVVVDVTRGMKVGIFTLSFDDLTVPVAGLPIQVIRTYDSRDNSNGDFGVGWRLGIKNVRLRKNRSIGLSWNETTQFSGFVVTYCLDPIRAKIVTITFPDGKVYRFQATTAPQCQNFGPIDAPTLTFTQLPGTAGTSRATLAPVDGTSTPGAVLFDGSIPGPGNLIGYDGLVYDPTVFKFTTAEGYEYIIDQNLGVTSLREPNGNTLTIGPNGVVHSSGRSIAISRDVEGRITRISDPANNAILYSYNASGDLELHTDRENNATAYSYDANHHLTAITDSRGVQPIRNTYDASGRLISTTDAFNRTISYTHNISGRQETITDRLGNATLYEYDDRGNVLRVTDPLGGVTSSTYDANDGTLTETNALGKTTSFTYDSFGNRLTETDPLGHTTAFTYNSRNQVLTVADPLGHTTTNVYDAQGNLRFVTDPLGKTTEYTYAGSVLGSVKDPLGHITSFISDVQGNLLSETDSAGTVTSYTYDANGNRLSQSVTRTTPSGPQTIVTGFQYDSNNRLIKTTLPGGATTQVVYDSIGKQVATISELNQQTTFTYDSMGRLTQTNFSDGTNERSTYDNEGRRTTSNDRAGRLTQYAYDLVGRLKRTTFPDLTFTETTYDAAGQVLTTRDQRGNVTTYAYDNSGRRLLSCCHSVHRELREIVAPFPPAALRSLITDHCS